MIGAYLFGSKLVIFLKAGDLYQKPKTKMSNGT